MKVLSVLILVFILTAGMARLITGQWNPGFSGNLAMFVMLCMTAYGHYKFAPGMVMMLPDVVPFKKEVILLTGVAEVVLGLCLLFPATRTVAGILLIALLVAMLPANIHAALKQINFEKADYSGSGPAYLWFRIPMQALFICWVWYFAIRH